MGNMYFWLTNTNHNLTNLAASNNSRSSDAHNQPCFILKDISINMSDKSSPFSIGLPSSSRMVNCNYSGCRICPMTWSENIVSSYTTLKHFGVIRNQPLDCQAKNLVYLITCNKCGLQYIGETKQTFRKRMMDHRRKIENKDICTIQYKHFLQHNHSSNDMRSQS